MANGPLQGLPLEYALYSNSQVSGELVHGVGPYELLNGLHGRGGSVAVRVVVRAYSDELDDVVPDMTRTDETWYHGGNALDEIAGLLALSLGTRFKAGGMTRMWGLTGDPKTGPDPLGRPVGLEARTPYLPAPAPEHEVLPSLARSVNLGDAADLLSAYFAAPPSGAIAIVRAARLYERAVWVADDDPQLAWLLLVSALEVGANQWVEDDDSSPPARLRALKPTLAAALEAFGQEPLKTVAEELDGQMRATWKFNIFTKEFLPSPPERRPPEPLQVDWSRLPKYLMQVYKRRSRALHAGLPFPTPMCDPPTPFGGGIIPERPIGLASGANDATWVMSDTPMLLNTFEYVARHTLLAWWRSVANKARGGGT